MPNSSYKLDMTLGISKNVTLDISNIYFLTVYNSFSEFYFICIFLKIGSILPIYKQNDMCLLIRFFSSPESESKLSLIQY